MTGFGTATTEFSQGKISVEVKSLNSKFLDAHLRLPKEYMYKDVEIRNVITKRLERGKISVVIEIESNLDSKPKSILNLALIETYVEQLTALATKLGLPNDNLLQTILQIPGVMENGNSNTADDDNWQLITQTIDKAIENCEHFRLDEGKQLETKFAEYIQKIEQNLHIIAQKDPERIKGIRDKITSAIQDNLLESQIDKNRFEQELIYYIEKLDISEEKVRLKNHLDYFLETMSQSDGSGKKLGFIAQEIGREINTIGSKANNADIQRNVVEMKEELEKIKEQALNIL